MEPYKQLTSEQRHQLSGLKKAGWKQARIAVEVGVDKSTISRELKRNKGARGWRPQQAQRLRDERRQGCVNGKQFSLNDWAEVKRLIRQDFSPEQAAARLAREGSLQIRTMVIAIRDEATCRGTFHRKGLKEFDNYKQTGYCPNTY